MNQNAFFDDLILGILYKKGSVSTLSTENDYGGVFDWQNVNNVVCNRKNKTSYINKGYMDYDSSNNKLSITEAGKQFIENKYSGSRK